jgi:hypothetical protein
MIGSSRAAVLRAKKWPNGSTLRVSFIGGDSMQQDIVRQFAPQWSQHANLKFEFTNAANAEIRSFCRYRWRPVVYRHRLSDIPLHEATMNLGWQDEEVVLHEFDTPSG